ncbi:MAG: ankyrin repeat domain-containing protein [Puniceicoccales bacterium]|nr:ankyrin repeat domain-containing protein [Puniceicoccales bacterium]
MDAEGVAGGAAIEKSTNRQNTAANKAEEKNALDATIEVLTEVTSSKEKHTHKNSIEQKPSVQEMHPQQQSTPSRTFEIGESVKNKDAIFKTWQKCINILKNFECREGDEGNKKIKLLLNQYPCLLTMWDQQRRTLLTHAVLLKRSHAIGYLLSLKCDLNVQDCDGNTPLHIAIKTGFIDGVVLLLYYGASPYIVNKEGFNACQLAFTLKGKEIAAFFWQKASIESFLMSSYTSNGLTKK